MGVSFRKQIKGLCDSFKSEAERLALRKISAVGEALYHDAINSAVYLDLTGNLKNSIAVGIYVRGKFLNYYRAVDLSAPMKPLHKGQVVNSKKFVPYSGSWVRAKKFKATVEGGNVSGDVLVGQLLRRGRIGGKGWALRVMAAMPYAEVVEYGKGKNVIGASWQAAGDIVLRAFAAG